MFYEKDQEKHSCIPTYNSVALIHGFVDFTKV